MQTERLEDFIAHINRPEVRAEANVNYEVYALNTDLSDTLKVDIGRTRALTKLLHQAVSTPHTFPGWMDGRDARSTLGLLQGAAHVARGQDRRVLYALANIARCAPEGAVWVRRRC